MVKINKRMFPIKAHFFFFMAAMGPILPQLAVLGKEIGISAEIMGYITSILPILYVLAKPLFGFVADYFAHFRKWLFMLLIIIMTLSYGSFYFLPKGVDHPIGVETHWNVTFDKANVQNCNKEIITRTAQCSTTRLVTCMDTQAMSNNTQFSAYLIDVEAYSNGHSALASNLLQPAHLHLCLPPDSGDINSNFNGTCHVDAHKQPDCIIWTSTFWFFVLFMSVGTIGYNVTNSISDAICFDMLGDAKTGKYGAQRVWGTIGFGGAALLAGIVVNLWTVDSAVKSFAPALVIMFIFSGFDLLSVSRLKLPKLSSSESIWKDVWILLKNPAIMVFLVFAVIAGIIDAFIIFFMFWHVEEVAAETGYMSQIKLIEGCVVAAECLAGEVPFFFYSGKIIKKLGYVHCMTMCFFFYAVRLAFISWIPNPWYLVGGEFFLQGCTYALCYTCIVAYASEVAPPGTSATVQGLMAGMDDGLGFSIGSLIGGIAFQKLGGRRSFRYFAIAALCTCVAHFVIRPTSRKRQYLPKGGYQVPKEQIQLEEVKEQTAT